MQGQFLVTESVSANVIHVERAGTLRSILGRGGLGFRTRYFALVGRTVSVGMVIICLWGMENRYRT